MGKFIFSILGLVIALILLIMVISLIANMQFKRSVDKEITEFLNDVENKKEVINHSDLESLPAPVQKWLQYSQVVGKEKIVAVRTKQDVSLRLKPDQPWMNAKAVQYFRTDEPGFIWVVDIKPAPLFHIAGRDRYIDGKGNILIKVLSLITVANGSGKEVDQGTLLRYLAETIWFPSAAISKYIKWEEIDSRSAKAIMTYKGVTASGIFTFNEKGEVLNFEAKRYGEFDGEQRLETWSCVINHYKEFDGIRIPSEGDIIWKLNSGDFHWYHFDVKEIEFNKPSLY